MLLVAFLVLFSLTAGHWFYTRRGSRKDRLRRQASVDRTREELLLAFSEASVTDLAERILEEVRFRGWEDAALSLQSADTPESLLAGIEEIRQELQKRDAAERWSLGGSKRRLQEFRGIGGLEDLAEALRRKQGSSSTIPVISDNAWSAPKP